MKNAINWFEIYTSDFERAKQFYSAVFKYKLTDIPTNSDRHRQMKYAIFSNTENGAGTSGELVWMDEAKPGIGGTMIYFNTDSINAELTRVEANGGKIVRPKTPVGDSDFIAFIEDTEGNMVGLRSTR